MNTKEFAEWVGQIGVVEAARLISEFEGARGAEGATYQAIQKWAANGIPPLRVLSVEAVSGISRHALRPDIYPADDAA